MTPVSSLRARTVDAWIITGPAAFAALRRGRRPIAASPPYASSSQKNDQTRQITCTPVKPLSQKYSDFQNKQITLITRPVLSHTRGGSRSSRTRGRMWWTLEAPETRAFFCGRQNRVVLTPRRWRQVPGQQNCSGATVAKKPGHRGDHDISRKPLRGECRVMPV